MYIDIKTFKFADMEVLAKKLAHVLQSDADVFEIIERKPFPESSTYPAEIIFCRSDKGKQLQLFLKYSSGIRYEFDSRKGLPYEAEVYEEIQRLQVRTVPYYGIFPVNDEESIMVLKYLPEGSSLEDVRGLPNFIQSAEWLASFHNSETIQTLFPRYDRAFYESWIQRALEYWQPTGEYPWLEDMACYFKEQLHLLLESQSLIHAEFFPSNIIVVNNKIYPIDWESAAFGPGEIDLASLVEAETNEDAEIIIKTYYDKRSSSIEYDYSLFRNRLFIAGIFLQFRYLLPKQLKKKVDYRRKRFRRLYQLGVTAGVLTQE